MDPHSLNPDVWWLIVANGVVLLLGVWIGLLRTRIERRNRQLEEETRARRETIVEFETTLRERERVAADLHDTLAQGLTAMAFQLEASEALLFTDPERSGRHLALARHLLASNREEMRRTVKGLRSHSLDGRTFAQALRDLAAAQCANRELQIDVDYQLDKKPVADFTAGNLLLLTQEAVGNAIRHGRAGRISISVRIFGRTLELAITDDGCGFDAARAAGVNEGHFGLQGMRERIKRLGGIFTIEATPGQGTRIVARVDLRAGSPPEPGEQP